MLSGCGGRGGTAQTEKIISETTISVRSDGPSDAEIGKLKVVVPANSFAPGTTVHLELIDSNQRPPNRDYSLAEHLLRASATSDQLGNISIQIPKQSLPDGNFIPAMKDGETGWIPLDFSETPTTYIIDVAPSVASPTRVIGLKNIIIAIGIGKLNETEPDAGLLLVGERTDNSLRTAVIVHGILSKHDAFHELSTKLLDSGRYDRVYSLSYDWRKGVKAGGSLLANELNRLFATKPKSVDVWAHSMGCLVTRYALERYDQTRPVRQCYFLDGPHEGTVAADIAAVLKVVLSLWLAADGNFYQGVQVLKLGDQAAKDLCWNIAVVNELRQSSGQRGNVNYSFIYCTSDELVGEASAFARTTSLEELSNGSVYRIPVDSLNLSERPSHSWLVQRPDGIDRLIAATTSSTLDNLTITSSPNPVNGVNGWDYSVTIKNPTSRTVVLSDLTIDAYSKSGAWQQVQWFEPTSMGTFPDHYSPWGVSLGAGKSTTIAIHSYSNASNDPISTLPLEYQAWNVVFSIRGSDTVGLQYLTSQSIPLIFNAVTPNPPITRAPGGRGETKEVLHGLAGPDR
jgi:pimeloyl-ACP methyl ester carboxylesterase